MERTTTSPARPGVDGQVRLLQLLATDASAAEIAAAAPDAAARELALRLRTAAHLSRRREQELEVLLEVAKDLAAMRDPAGVLDALVRRAKALLATDVAYLTLFDPDRGDTFMRTTAGSISASFQTLRLPLGDGLGGLVASTHTPYWTTDYTADDRFRHTGPIDAAVGEEGIVAICGTPLIVKDDFVGVLFAGHRTPRSFSRDEVALLGSLAALAAVSLVQVRALDETARALSALSSAHETVRRQAEGVERAAAAHDRFADLVLGGGGVDDITGAVTSLMGGWAVLLDDAGAVRSRSGDPPDLEADLVSSVGADPTGRLRRAGARWTVPVVAVDQVLGCLVVGGVGELDDSDRRTIERAAVVTALVLLIERNRAEALQQRRTDLVDDLVLGRGDAEGRLLSARAHGFDPGTPQAVVVVRGRAGSNRHALTMSVGALASPAALVGERDGDVVVIVPGGEPASLALDLASRLRRTGGATAGAAGPVVGVESLPEAYADARRAVDALLALGREGEGASLAELGFAGLVVGGAPDVAAYVDRVLGPLIAYDTARGTDLVTTLDAWFRAGRSPRHAASALHVHVNTVSQRIDRVTSVLGDGWQEPLRSLEVQLALQLRRVLAPPST